MVRNSRAVLAASMGQMLPLVLILFAVGVIVVVPLLYYASSTSKAVAISGEALDGFYAADAGVEYALSVLRGIGEFNGTLAETVNGNTVAVVTVADSPPGDGFSLFYWVITSTATRDGKVTSQLRAKVTEDSSINPNPVTVTEFTVLE